MRLWFSRFASSHKPYGYRTNNGYESEHETKGRQVLEKRGIHLFDLWERVRYEINKSSVTEFSPNSLIQCPPRKQPSTWTFSALKKSVHQWKDWRSLVRASFGPTRIGTIDYRTIWVRFNSNRETQIEKQWKTESRISTSEALPVLMLLQARWRKLIWQSMQLSKRAK